MPLDRTINLANPVNRANNLTTGLRVWALALPGLIGGGQFLNLMSLPGGSDSKYRGTLTNFAGQPSLVSGWSGTDRLGGFAQIVTDGSNDSVNFGDIASGGAAFTASISFYWLVDAANGATFYSQGDNGGHDFDLLILPPSNVLQFYYAAGPNVTSTTVIVIKKWYTITVTYDLTFYRLYIDGILETTSASAPSRNTQVGSFYLGGTPVYPTRYANARLDDLKYYDRSLSSDEVKLLRNEALAGYPTTLNRLPNRLISVPDSGPAIVSAQGAAYEFSLALANQYRWSAAAYEFSDATASASFNIGLTAEVIEFSSAYAIGATNPAMTLGLRAQSNANAIAQVNRLAPVIGSDCCFVFPYNRWSDRTLGTIAASTQIATFPVANTQVPQRSRVWRSDAQKNAYIIRDLGSAYRINSFVLVSHNATNTGTFRVRVGNDPTFTSNLYDSGYLPTWEASFDTTGILGELAETDGRPTNATIELLRYCSENARTVRWIIFDEVAARYIRVDFLDNENTLGWNEVAYIYAGLVINIQPEQLYNWTLEFATVNRVRVAASGQLWIDDLYKQVKATATFGQRPSSQILSFFYWVEQKLGTTGEIIISFQPESLQKKMFFSLYGRIVEMPELEHVAFGSFNTQLVLEELM